MQFDFIYGKNQYRYDTHGATGKSRIFAKKGEGEDTYFIELFPVPSRLTDQIDNFT